MQRKPTFIAIGLSAVLGAAACEDNNPVAPEPDLAEPAPPQIELAVKLKGTGSGIVSSSPAGIVCGQNCIGFFPLGKSVQLIATADFQSTFEGFGGACTGTMCSLTPTLNEPIDVFANFRRLPCMPASTVGCNECVASYSFVPGSGTSTCSPASEWGPCLNVLRSRTTIAHRDLAHGCANGYQTGDYWYCPALSYSVQWNNNWKSLAKGKYVLSGGAVSGYSTTYGSKAIQNRVRDMTTGEILKTETSPWQCAWRGYCAIEIPTVSFEAPEGCHSFKFETTSIGDGLVNVIISAYAIVPQ